MSQPSPGVPIAPGTPSPDGVYVWNGSDWVQMHLARFSPDRAYIWNGTQWVATAPGQSRVPVPNKGHGLRNAGIGVLGCIGLAIVGIIVISAIGSSLTATPSANKSAPNSPSGRASTGGSPSAAARPTSAPSTPKPVGCVPKPCASAFSLTVRISHLNRKAPVGFLQPEPGNHLVLMQMAVHNDGGQDTKTVSPFDFKLRDAAGVEHDVTLSDSPGCTLWAPVALAPHAAYGPKPLCFEASGKVNGSLTLLWSPDLFSATQEIPL